MTSLMLLAQATPTPPAAQWLEPFSSVAQAGLLGALLAVALWAILKLYHDLSTERAERLNDAKAVTELVRASTAATVQWVASQEDRNRSMDNMTAALQNLRQVK